MRQNTRSPHGSAGRPLDRDARRGIFYLKTDLSLADAELRAIKTRAEAALVSRTEIAGALAAKAGLSGTVTPLAAGSYHIIHGVHAADGKLTGVVRSTLDDIFEQDFGLAIEGAVRQWLLQAGADPLAVATLGLGYRIEGAPFDYAILAAAPGVELRSLGDESLDERPELLASIGRALANTHRRAATGAGLLDPACLGHGQGPRGVFDTWAEYIALHFGAHVDACLAAGLIDGAMASQIRDLHAGMTPHLRGRPMSLLHGDPGPHNICVDPVTGEVVALLDWEDAMAGDPLFDVAMFQTFMPQRRDAAFLEGYGLGGASRDDLRLIAFYFLRIALSKTVHRIRFDVKDRPGRTPGHHRILRGVDDLVRLM